MVRDIQISSETSETAQFAALCWRVKKAAVEVLLVTSRDTGRWVIPKGWPMPGLSPSDTAAREAWEEAGVKGQITDEALGCFDYLKAFNQRQDNLACQVQVFALRVSSLAAKFPERKQRRRKWFSALKAAKLVDEAGLSDLIKGFLPGEETFGSALAAQ
jgi:8-oxo-dGTP pyrophosphatase MutT (NUDIX family)